MTDKRIKVSAAMVAAGLKVLRESHALAVELSSDHLLVRSILEAAFRAQKSGQQQAKHS